MKHYIVGQNKEILNILVMIAIQLGIEQGRRIVKSSYQATILRTMLERIKSNRGDKEMFDMYMSDAEMALNQLLGGL